MIRYGECRPPARSCLSRAVSDVGSTNCWCGHHPCFLQGLNYDVHGWVGYFFAIFERKKSLVAPAIEQVPLYSPQRVLLLRSDIDFVSDMHFERLKLERRISYRCDRWAQYRVAEATISRRDIARLILSRVSYNIKKKRPKSLLFAIPKGIKLCYRRYP
jgi:hypothetical protein